MTDAEATAESFVRILKALPKAERAAVVVCIAQDDEFAEDIADLITIDRRREEPSRPLREFLSEQRST